MPDLAMYDLMVRVRNRVELEKVGEAELPATLPEVATVRGLFVPASGYARVRDAFRKPDLDAIDLMRPRLYREGIWRPSERISIADDREIVVELDRDQSVESPLVDSQTQLLRTSALWRCPTCGGSTTGGNFIEHAFPGSRFAGGTYRNCSTCVKAWWLMFPKSPQWTDG